MATIVILGGGVGGLVTANTLRRRLDRRHRIVLVDRVGQHVYTPSFLWMMLGWREPPQITRDLAPGSVDLRLRGRDVEFVVTQPNTEPDNDERPAAPLDLDDASTSRTTLRLPDALKARVDEAAAADGLSVNTWLVRAVATALQPKQRRSAQRTLRTGDNFAGWAR